MGSFVPIKLVANSKSSTSGANNFFYVFLTVADVTEVVVQKEDTEVRNGILLFLIII